MVTIVSKKIFNSDAKFVVNAVDCNGEIRPNVLKRIFELYPHAEKEYMKYVKKCEKNKLDMLGTVQYIPVDTWALVLVDTIKNNVVEAYDTNYQYIVNAFVQETKGKKNITDIMAIQRVLINLKEKAEKIDATIAIPYNFGCGKNIQWHEVLRIIKNVFDNSKVQVEIYKGK